MEYRHGNEMIIQPKHSRLKEMANHLAVANIFVGAAIGAAIIWFLVAPGGKPVFIRPAEQSDEGLQ